MAMFRLHLNTQQLTAAKERLRHRFPVAIARGMNRTGKSEKTAMSREIAKDMALKIGDVKDAIAVDEAIPSRLRVRVIARGAPIPLIKFHARGPEPSRGRGRGVTARLPGGRGRYPHAFIGSMASLMRFVEGSSDELPTRVEDALQTMAVVEAAYRDSEAGGTEVSL